MRGENEVPRVLIFVLFAGFRGAYRKLRNTCGRMKMFVCTEKKIPTADNVFVSLMITNKEKQLFGLTDSLRNGLVTLGERGEGNISIDRCSLIALLEIISKYFMLQTYIAMLPT